jgi:CsoR family transcriptional regulator, copper-sensing transcriptional repressor
MGGVMMESKNNSNENKNDILKRLNRIEGQVRGIQRMISEEKSCADILTQVAAVRAAINKVGGLVLENYSKVCIQNTFNSENKEKGVEDLVSTVQKFLKFVE